MISSPSKLFNSAKQFFLLIVICALCFGLSYGFTPQDNRYATEISKIEDYVQKELERIGLPSLSLAFYKDDFFWAKSFGYANLELKVPAEPDTRYRLASISKPITAVGILRLMQDGKLELDDEVQKYVPYFPQKRWPLTIRHVLGHLGGISHYRNYDEEGHFTTHFTTENSVGVFKDWELESQPGTRYRYSSYGFNLLGAVIEGASGEPYAEYMSKNVWKPLGMDDTTMDVANVIMDKRANGYQRIGGELKNCEFVDMSSRFAGGGIRSTAVDLINLSRGLDQGKVLRLDTQMKMYNGMVTRAGQVTGYGMGWFVDFIQGFWNVSHGGGQQGTSTYLLRFPEERFAVAVMCNEQNQNTARYARMISGLILGAFPYRLQVPDMEQLGKLRMTLNIGAGFYGKYNSTFAVDDEDLRESFAYFNRLTPEAGSIIRKVSAGIQVSSGAPLVKVGTYMADRLSEKLGEEGFKRLIRDGSIPFFKAYVDLYKDGGSIPEEYRFDEAFESMLEEWHASLTKTWTEETRNYFFVPVADLGKYIEAIKDRFSGEIVYPQLNVLFNTYAYYLKGEGKADQGLEVLLDAVELYPSDANLYDSIGEYYLAAGNKSRAKEYYLKALEKDPNLASSRMAVAKLEGHRSLDYLMKHTRVKPKK